jgi:hypothetical protein
MALFSGKIIDAHYIDLEYSLVELTYTGDDGKIYAHALRVDPHNQEWLDLLAEGWDQARLLDGTAEYKRQASADFNSQVNELARKLAEEMFESKKDLKRDLVQTDNEIFDFVLNSNEDKEELFKFKIWALELDKMQFASKEQKSEIRKAKSIIEGFWILSNINVAAEP